MEQTAQFAPELTLKVKHLSTAIDTKRALSPDQQAISM